MPQTINFRHNSNDNTIIINDCKTDIKQTSDNTKCKLIRNLKRNFGRESQNRSTRLTDIKAKIALKSFTQNKNLLKLKS